MPPKAPPIRTYAGTAYRVTTYDEPLWVDPNRRSGRWNVAGDGCTQYLCLDAEAPYAEMLRAEDLRTEQEARMYQSTIWQLRVDEGAIVDYSTFDLAERAGFDPEALIEDDFGRCQAEARRLRELGVRGILSPSAALSGSLSLTLFGPRHPADRDFTVQLASMVPAQRLAIGHAPAGLVERVTFRGQPHAGYDEWISQKAKLRRRRPKH